MFVHVSRIFRVFCCCRLFRINFLFYVSPKIKIERVQIKWSWWPFVSPTTHFNPSIWNLLFQKFVMFRNLVLHPVEITFGWASHYWYVLKIGQIILKKYKIVFRVQMLFKKIWTYDVISKNTCPNINRPLSLKFLASLSMRILMEVIMIIRSINVLLYYQT